ncbi:MAG TPA: phosphoribosylformylglycinamidine synthase subunit PurQ [Thermomicrobiales bacterium]
MSDLIGVITFPGSNGDHDALHAISNDIGAPARLVDYRETDLSPFAALIVPGGFSYGDYLRCGAIARFAPIVEPLREFAARGGPVLGICNGFQVLTEAHLLPGALLRNKTLRFHCHWTWLRIEQTDTAWTGGYTRGEIIRLPVAHGDGSYYADPETLARLEDTGRVVARYCTAEGEITDESNPNGSLNAIAGVANERGNVVGLMPHPERATDPLIGGDDGLRMLRSVLAFLPAGVTR